MSTNSIVLVLNADFRPLRVEHWHKAIAASFLGKVEVVEYSKDRTIKGVSREYPMPSVVRLLRWFKRDRQVIKFSRLNIYTRDGFICQYCEGQMSTEDLTFDHVVPRAKGGRTSWDNIVTCCIPCNAAKGNKLLAETFVHRTTGVAGLVFCDGPGCDACNTSEPTVLKPLWRPVKPKWLPAITVETNRRVPEEWKPYWHWSLDL